ncbi:MAG: DNA repair protein RadA [Actinomycetia bacterium]|nr:DNA repair protein RadA [Actinomycetes bacterium]
MFLSQDKNKSYGRARERRVSRGRPVLRCGKCGYVSSKWLGRCPNCNEWDTFVEEAEKDKTSIKTSSPQSLSSITSESLKSLKTTISEFDRVLGGGIIAGSAILVGGEPGVGKSTLLLQVADKLAKTGKKVLVVSGEESLSQMKLRANRIGKNHEGIYVYNETNVLSVLDEFNESSFDLVIVDSIQTLFNPEISSNAGSINQLRECSSSLIRKAKEVNIPIILIGHVTKDGLIAGPRVLEHMVDTVLYFDNSTSQNLRIIRSVKNRFGSTNEIGIFQMTSNGLEEVKDPSGFFLNDERRGCSGYSIVPVMEGTRPILLEVQALTVSSYFPSPRRVSVGIDYNRLLLVVAVLEKKLNLRLGNLDIYINITGGVKVFDPAVDLGLSFSIASAVKDQPLPEDTVIFGEMGLGGEIRPVPFFELRVKEAKKRGFKRIICPEYDKISQKGIEITPISTIKELLKIF